MQGLEFVYVAFFLVGVAGSLGVWWWSHRSERRRELDAVRLAATPIEPTHAHTPKPAARATLSPQLPAVLSEPQRVTELILAPARTTGERECPTCQRQFGEATLVCPFDATPLKLVADGLQATSRPGSNRPTCRQCGRRFDSAAKYCYHHGSRLMNHSPTEVPIVRVCRSCGFESLNALKQCGCETPDIVEIDAARTEVIMPTIPMMHCRRCDRVEAPGATHCSEDGELLYPVMNVALTTLPSAGIGPRRKVCESCGRKFAAAARYCTYDGKRLLPLN